MRVCSFVVKYLPFLRLITKSAYQIIDMTKPKQSLMQLNKLDVSIILAYFLP